jgi:hypothetical protein
LSCNRLDGVFDIFDVENAASAAACVGAQDHALPRHVANSLGTPEGTNAAAVESYVPPACTTNL